MSEIVSVGGGQRRPSSAPPKYVGQPEPVQRNRLDKDEWRRVERDNATLHKKLHALAREPPSSFHAPLGYDSVRGGAAAKTAKQGKPQNMMAETQHYVPPRPWPPTSPHHEPIRRSQSHRAMDTGNTHMHKKLQEVYRRPPTATLAALTGRPGIDCNPRWALRTSVYDPKSPFPPSAGGAVLDLEQASVPKSLAVAACNGCGAKCFYSADGKKLTRCRHCKAAWYCSTTCAKADWLSHKQMCKYHTTGQWTPHGQRPAEEYWVNNAAMAKVRRMLHRRTDKADVAGEVEEQFALDVAYKAARQRELEADRRQADIEWRALHGLDGPRPCMCENGKQI